MEEISDKIKNLSHEETTMLNYLNIHNLHSRSWCHRKKINYNDPDISKAREITYEEIQESGKTIAEMLECDAQTDIAQADRPSFWKRIFKNNLGFYNY